MGREWIKETMEVIEDWENEYQALQTKYEQIANELMDLGHKIQSGNELIRDYMNKHNITSIEPTLVAGSLANKSYPQMIVEIAQKSNGILNYDDAVEIIAKENPNINKGTIKHNTRTAIYRMRKHFVQINKGQYRYTNGIHTPEVKKAKPQRSKKIVSGVQSVIKEMKDKNPQMTRKEVLNNLLESGFDFKGKKPVNAVNIVWAKLGYSKEGKQQSLPGVA